MNLWFFTLVCASLIFCVTSNNIDVGKREDGDALVASRRLLRVGVPNKPSIARTGINVEGTITLVKAVNAPGSNALVTILKGGPGTSSVVVGAISKPGSGIDIQLDIYAQLDPVTTTEPSV